eukprot:CAMPEP_0202693826 /NCGR_PEP_ID=MMETSP1385-20130828/7840_1 /ASSEMBLY_ACC=CAM_ASM_000861 /TAXON_ID=933848 /ORGANISM="Elphidium margaritaceum" /LENGTH=568 /DNA_ID=CAMNT_0049349565 /DNA_START=472 /DNA_END=2178 /DNA_ORIENTATION=-
MASSFSNLIYSIFETISPQTQPSSLNDSNTVDGSGYAREAEHGDDFEASLNQDASCLSVATAHGFRIYQCKPFCRAFECTDNVACRKVAMLFSTSLVALVGGAYDPSYGAEHAHTSLRNVKLYNTKNKQELCRLNFKSTVLDVKINKSRLCVCVEHKIHIFDLINNMRQIYEIATYHNPCGIFSLCCDEDNCLIAYPDKSKKGAIGILDAYNLQKRVIFQAHDSLLQHIAFNADGNYLCSASIMGTLIRVFAIPSGTLLYVFRRGAYPALIYSIAFNPSSTLLVVSAKKKMNLPSINSAISQAHAKAKKKKKSGDMSHAATHETTAAAATATTRTPSIHVFDLNKYKYNESKKVSSSDSINQLNSRLNEYLPVSVKNQIEHPRSIITISLKSSSAVICGWLNDYSLVCATRNGYFYRYSINDNLRSYKLLSEHTLRDDDHDLHNQQRTKIYKQQSGKHAEEEEKEEKKTAATDTPPPSPPQPEQNVETDTETVNHEIQNETDTKPGSANQEIDTEIQTIAQAETAIESAPTKPIPTATAAAVKSNLGIDDLFDLSDGEYDASNGNTPQ